MRKELAKLALIVAEEGWGDALGHARFARSWCDTACGHRALRVLGVTAGREPEMPELVSRARVTWSTPSPISRRRQGAPSRRATRW